MSDPFPPSQDEIRDTFEDLQDWQDKYEFLLDLGRELPPLNSRYQTEANKVQGCMSTVWLAIEPQSPDDTAGQPISIYADSDSLIVKGLIVILLSLYQGKTPEESIAVDPADFFARWGSTSI